MKGRRKQAENILSLIARRNNRSFKEPILPDEDEEAQRDEQRVSFIAFCSYPRLLCNTFVIFSIGEILFKKKKPQKCLNFWNSLNLIEIDTNR